MSGPQSNARVLALPARRRVASRGSVVSATHEKTATAGSEVRSSHRVAGTFSIPRTPHPWRVIEHDGQRFKVRHSDGACWVVRISDRAMWLFGPADTAPSWTREEPNVQRELF